MSDTGSPIKTPKQLLYAILAAFLIPIAVIVLLSQYVGNLKNPSNSSDAYTEDKVLERIAPIGSIRTEPVLARTGSVLIDPIGAILSRTLSSV